ncbi:MAG: helix-turn-helix transcriptional regulator [Phenylobacterium sp.]
MLMRALDLATTALAANTAEDASAAFYEAMTGLGASYLQTRVYRRPLAPLTSTSHFAAGGVIARFAPPTWPGSPAFNYICFDCNPLLNAIRSGLTRYRFSDFAPKDSEAYRTYWDAMSEARIDDALCATSYGPDRAIASLHLGFERRSFAPEEALSIHMAGLLLTERLLTLAEPAGVDDVRLTDRERDSLAWVAEGKSDWEIAVILGLAESTVRFHVDNARRKLGAVNRTQAVARLAAARLL